MNIIWNNVFKNGLRKICKRQDFKNLNGYGLLPYTFKIKGCFLQILLGPFLNNLTHLIIDLKLTKTSGKVRKTPHV